MWTRVFFGMIFLTEKTLRLVLVLGTSEEKKIIVE